MSYDIRLRAYAPGTDTPLGLLPDPLSWSASIVHNNDGALTLKYSELAENGDIAARTLDQGLDVALEVNWGATASDWREPDNCRFLTIDHDWDRTDDARVHDLTLPSWSWLLNKICDLNLSALAGKKSKNAGMRVFSASRDAGDVVKTMLNEHDARSGPAVPILRDSWGGGYDSLGNAWAKKLGRNADGRAFPPGQPLHAKMDALVSNGLCDYRTRGRGMRMYNQNTASADLHATVKLRYGSELSDAPTKTSQADRVARLLVKGDGKHRETVRDPSVPEHYGRWEALLDSAGVKDDDDLEDAGEAALDDRNRIKGQYTRTLLFESATWLPFRDYNVGDWVTAPGASGDETLRVMQITITRDEQAGLSGNVVLGDRFTNRDLALAGRVSAITGGTTGVIGNGMVGTTLPQDTRQPEAPANLAVTDELVLNAFGEWVSTGTFTWDPVTTATDGTDLEIARYELLGQEQTTPPSQWHGITVSSAADATVSKTDFRVGSSWLFTVRAYGVTTTEPGVQSPAVAHTFSTDDVAPAAPSEPTVQNWLGSLVVAWDGLDLVGDPMPLDYDRCEVHLSTAPGFTPDPSTLKATFTNRGLARGGTVTLSGLAYETPIYVVLVAYDMSGNASDPSAEASGTPRRVVSDDLAAEATAGIRDSVLDTVRTTLGGRAIASEDDPPGTYDGASGDKWEKYTTEGDLLAVWKWNGATWDALSIDPTYIPQIDIGLGTFGSLAGNRLAAQSVAADKLEADMVLVNTLYAGLTSGNHTRISGSGLTGWGPNPGASNAIEPWLWVANAIAGAALQVGFDQANPVAKISAKGNAQFQSVSTGAFRVGGATLDEILAPLPKGRVAWTLRDVVTSGVTSTETAIVELRTVLEPNRIYTIGVPAFAAQSTVAGDKYRVNLRYALNGTAVTTSSAGLRLSVTGQFPDNSVYFAQPGVEATLRTTGWTAPREARFLFTIVRYTGSGTISVWGSSTQPINLFVRDEGADLAPSTTAIRYVSTWSSTALYQNGAGSVLTSGRVRTTSSGTLLNWVHALFNGTSSGSEATTLAAAMSGASLLKAEAYIYASKESSDNDWVTLVVKGSSATTASSTPPTWASGDPEDTWEPPEGRWLDISSIFTTAWRSLKLMTIGGPQDTTVLNTSTHKMLLRLTYLR